MLMVKFEGVCVCTDEDVPLVLCTPEISDGITVMASEKGMKGTNHSADQPGGN